MLGKSSPRRLGLYHVQSYWLWVELLELLDVSALSNVFHQCRQDCQPREGKPEGRQGMFQGAKDFLHFGERRREGDVEHTDTNRKKIGSSWQLDIFF